MMVLDTNTLYYACGLSTPPINVDKNKLRRAISSTEDVVISYVTLAEFLTKYRKHARIIRRTCSYMRDNHIRVIDCEYMPVDRQFLMLLTKIRQKDFNKEFERIINTKIDIASRIASAIFFVLLICETIFECNIDPMNLTAPAFGFLSYLFEILRETIIPVFNELYRDAYKTDDAENYIRRGVYRLLDTLIPILMPLCQKVINLRFGKGSECAPLRCADGTAGVQEELDGLCARGGILSLESGVMTWKIHSHRYSFPVPYPALYFCSR